MPEPASHPPRVPADAFIIPDHDSFLRALDLELPDLKEVKSALEDGDVEGAKSAFIRYYRTRAFSSPLLRDWAATERDPEYHNSISEDCLNDRIPDGYNGL